MPEYLSAAALLADASLRLDAFGRNLGVIVVEGPDDKRLFYARVWNPAQILVSGGRTLLLSAFGSRSETDHDAILFFTDCDYAVRRGELSGGHGLVITSGTNTESDLLALGLLAPVVTEIVPGALDRNRVGRTCDEILRIATLLSLPLGRMRMAAQPLGIDLRFDELDFAKYWNRRTGTVNVNKLMTVTASKLRAAGVLASEWARLVAETPSDERMCNGKDLVRAIRFVLHSHYRVANQISGEVLTRMLRLALHREAFENWAVVRRIRQWEAKTGRLILKRE